MMPQVLFILREGLQCFFNKSKSNVSNPKQWKKLSDNFIKCDWIYCYYFKGNICAVER